MKGLAGKRIVIAGAATGIGAATAERLAAEGARVIVGDINVDGARATAERIGKAGGEARAVAFDMADGASIAALIASAVSGFGGIDGLANVAADLSPQTMGGDADVLNMSVAIWERTFRVNVIGYALACQAAIREFTRQGKGGAIVNVASEAANAGEDTRPAYAASKAAVTALTRHVALRFGPEGIRCNSVAPGIVLSETAIEQMPADFKQKWLMMTTVRRFGRPDDIAGTISFLLSDDSSYIHGQVWHANGGSHFHG
jgi:NAD(P)-dependent dehydrogenase (short-subunit alcohol dehydrogenase family)